MALSEEKRAFADQMLQRARGVVKGRAGEPWVAEWMAAIACQESGWGENPIGTYNVVGYHWAPRQEWSGEWIEARETSTGKIQRYRKFASYQDCFEALYYLISRSSYYTSSRVDYERAIERIEHQQELARHDFMQDFSLEYSTDPNHGDKVVRIMEGFCRPNVDK